MKMVEDMSAILLEASEKLKALGLTAYWNVSTSKGMDGDLMLEDTFSFNLSGGTPYTELSAN